METNALTQEQYLLQSGLFLLAKSSIKGRFVVDLTLDQIRESIFYFGGCIDLIHESDDETFLTYKTKLGKISLVSNLIISPVQYSLQVEALSSKTMLFEAGVSVSIIDNKYFVV